MKYSLNLFFTIITTENKYQEDMKLGMLPSKQKHPVVFIHIYSEVQSPRTNYGLESSDYAL